MWPFTQIAEFNHRKVVALSTFLEAERMLFRVNQSVEKFEYPHGVSRVTLAPKIEEFRVAQENYGEFQGWKGTINFFATMVGVRKS